MSSYIGAIFLVVGFIVLLHVFDLVTKSIRVINLSKKSLSDFSNPELNDDQKEELMQEYAKQIGLLFILLTVGAAVALLAPAAIVWVLDKMGLMSFDDVMQLILSWEFIIGGTILMIITLWLGKRRKSGV